MPYLRLSQRLNSMKKLGRGRAFRSPGYAVESLEDRVLFALFNVININDSGVGSLRQAILNANANVNSGGPDQINFAITGSATINLLTALPSITDPVFIDGRSEPDFVSTPVVELNGASAGAGANGLVVAAGGAGSTIRGLAINRFGANGIQLLGGSCTIAGNYVGTSLAGTADLGNGAAGIGIESASNVIGGTAAIDRNIISGNLFGVTIATGGNNTVLGNYIGLAANGDSLLGNSDLGVFVTTAGNIIGQTVPGGRNVISGNGYAGVMLNFASSNNLVVGNYIGTDATGTLDRGNANAGVIVDSGSSNTIGGTTTAARNVISGNAEAGIRITGQGATVQGNYIGTDATGVIGIANDLHGIYILNSNGGNLIGGAVAGAGNVISGHSNASGIAIRDTVGGPPPLVNTIQGNFIGTNASGTAAINNTVDGIYLENVTGTIIGGTTAAARNVISGNGYAAIEIGQSAHFTQILGNYIGTTAAGTAALSNGSFGIRIFNANSNMVGGTSSGARNIISGNGFYGVVVLSTSNSNQVMGNYIGTNAAGTAALPNGSHGVYISNSPGSNTIGGSVAGAGNLISGNIQSGIQLQYDSGTVGTGNTIQGNFIGTNAAGDAALSNGGAGITVQGVNNTTIGGTTPAARNVISGNSSTGVQVNSGSIVFRGNYIGINAAGTAAVPNAAAGIEFQPAGSGTVGGTGAGEGNVISGNANTGIFISGAAVSIVGNVIGANAAGTTAVPNASNGISIFNPVFGTMIGGYTAGSRNVISSNAANGIFVSGAGTGGVNIASNYIGVGANGVSPLGNDGHGVYLISGARLTVVGNFVAAGANIIANNSGAGVAIATSAGAQNAIASNSIYANALLGIDLGQDGVTPNDAGDADTGVNGLLNYPVITGVLRVGSRTIINGNLNTTANTSVSIQFFTSAAPDSSGFGEGQTLVDTYQFVTNASGNTTFSLDLPFGLTPGLFLSATTISGFSETSEFSAAVEISDAPSFGIDDVTVTEGNSGTTALTFTVYRSGNTSVASSVLYTTADGTAVAPGDYLSAGGTILSFAAGEISKTVTVHVKGDNIDEANETFVVNLSSAVTATIGDAQGVGTIIDDDADLSPPAVLASLFNFVGVLPTPYEVKITLGETVTPSSGGVPLLIRRVDNGQLVATVMASIQSGNIVRGLMNTPLPDGNYRATLPAGAVIDLANNALAADVVVDFFILGGDANRDRKVDISDLYTLSSNWQGTGKTFGQGDFNYDGKVDAYDLSILAARWQQNLPPPAPALTSLPLAGAARRTPVRVATLVI